MSDMHIPTGPISYLLKLCFNKFFNLEYVQKRKNFEALFYSESSGARKLSQEEKDNHPFIPSSLKDCVILDTSKSRYKDFKIEDIERYLRYLENFNENKVLIFKKYIRNDKLNMVSKLSQAKSQGDFLKDFNLNILSDILKKEKVDFLSLLKKYLKNKRLQFKYKNK